MKEYAGVIEVWFEARDQEEADSTMKRLTVQVFNDDAVSSVEGQQTAEEL